MLFKKDKFLEKVFGFDSKTMSVKKEIVAGATTFFTMCYILAVNPDIMAMSGMDKGSVFTATALVGVIATLFTAIVAKLPFAQSPGMGSNTFFVFTLVKTMGYSWEAAITAVLVEGICFLILFAFGWRDKIVNIIPFNIRHSITIGIGLFIAFVGLKTSGIIVSHPDTMISLGNLKHPMVVLSLISIIMCWFFVVRNVKAGLFLAIVFTTIIGILIGQVSLDGFVPVDIPSSISPTFMKFDFSILKDPEFLLVILVLLVMEMFNTIGSFLGAASAMPKEYDILKDRKRLNKALAADAVGTTLGAMVGTSSSTTFVESSSGIIAGGRSGLTAFVVAVLFALSLFFSPIFMLIPTAATTGVLFVVGVYMLDSIRYINIDDITELIPFFVIIIMTPLTYSIADGIMLGIISYVIVKMLNGKFKQVSIPILLISILFCLKYILF